MMLSLPFVFVFLACCCTITIVVVVVGPFFLLCLMCSAAASSSFSCLNLVSSSSSSSRRRRISATNNEMITIFCFIGVFSPNAVQSNMHHIVSLETLLSLSLSLCFAYLGVCFLLFVRGACCFFCCFWSSFLSRSLFSLVFMAFFRVVPFMITSSCAFVLLFFPFLLSFSFAWPLPPPPPSPLGMDSYLSLAHSGTSLLRKVDIFKPSLSPFGCCLLLLLKLTRRRRRSVWPLLGIKSFWKEEQYTCTIEHNRILMVGGCLPR